MIRLLALAVVVLSACGNDNATSAVVEVDTTQVSPTPDTLFLALTAPTGDVISHTSDVATGGVTRIELLATEHTPKTATLTVSAYLERSVVAQSQPADISFTDGKITNVAVTLP